MEVGEVKTGFKTIRRCPRCGGEMQADKDDYFCVICGYRRRRIYTYSGDGKAILTRRPHLGTDMHATLSNVYEDGFEQPVNMKKLEYANRLYAAVKREGQAVSRTAERAKYRWQSELLPKHPEIRRWLSDNNVNPTVRDDVERLHSVLCGETQGWRPEYLFTVLCQIVYDAHNLPFNPPAFVKNINWATYYRYYERVFNLLKAKKTTCLRTPTGSIELKKRHF